jgi:hypothetical protein
MDISELAALLERGETHRLILGDYKGPYALGIGRDPNNANGYGFVLKVPDAKGWPRSVVIEGQRIPIVVQGGFKAPERYR